MDTTLQATIHTYCYNAEQQDGIFLVFSLQKKGNNYIMCGVRPNLKVGDFIIYSGGNYEVVEITKQRDPKGIYKNAETVRNSYFEAKLK